MGSCGTCLPPWATAFLHRPVPPPSRLPLSLALSPFPPAALLWALLPSFRLVSFRFVLPCSVACLLLPLFASCPVLFCFVSPRLPSFLYWLPPGAI